MGSNVVPFLGLPQKDPKYEPLEGTTMEPMGSHKRQRKGNNDTTEA